MSCSFSCYTRCIKVGLVVKAFSVFSFEGSNTKRDRWMYSTYILAVDMYEIKSSSSSSPFSQFKAVSGRFLCLPFFSPRENLIETICQRRSIHRRFRQEENIIARLGRGKAAGFGRLRGVKLQWIRSAEVGHTRRECYAYYRAAIE